MTRRRQVAERIGFGVLVLVLLGGVGGAVAGAAIGSAQILDNSVRSRDVKDGTLLVGLCVRNNSSHTMSNNGAVNGYARVTQ